MRAWGESGGINPWGLREEGLEWGAAPFRLSGLPESTDAAQAGWGLAGLGICTSWALGSALLGVGVG